MEAEALFASFFITMRSVAGPLGGLLRGMAAFLAFAPQTGLRHYLKAMLNDPFAKLPHPWNWFDAAMLLPYFAVMIRAGALRHPPLHHVLPVLQVPQELQSQPAPAFRRTAAGHRPTAHLQRAVRHRPADRGRLRDGVSAREARNPGARRLHRRNAGGGSRHRRPLRRARAIPSSTSTAPTATASRPARSTPASRWPRASSSPSSTPTSFPRPTGS